MSRGASPMARPQAMNAPVELPASRSKLRSSPGLPAAARASSTPASHSQVIRPRMPPPSSDRMRLAFMALELLLQLPSRLPPLPQGSLSLRDHHRDLADAGLPFARAGLVHGLAV